MLSRMNLSNLKAPCLRWVQFNMIVRHRRSEGENKKFTCITFLSFSIRFELKARKENFFNQNIRKVSSFISALRFIVFLTVDRIEQLECEGRRNESSGRAKSI